MIAYIYASDHQQTQHWSYPMDKAKFQCTNKIQVPCWIHAMSNAFLHQTISRHSTVFSIYSTTESTDHMPCTWQCSPYKKYKFHAVSAHGRMQVGIRPLADTALIISRIYSTDESIVYVHGNAPHTKYKFPCCARYWLNAVLHRTISGHSIYHSSCMQHWFRHRLNTMYIVKLNTQTHLSCCIWQWSAAFRNPAKADTALVIAHEHSADRSIGHAPSTWQSSGYKIQISMLRPPMIECSLESDHQQTQHWPKIIPHPHSTDENIDHTLSTW